MSPFEPESPEDRTARHQRVLQELAELGMDLARAAARQAQHHLETQQAAPPDPPLEQPAHAKTPIRKPADPALVFTRLCSAVRQTVALEARITAGHLPPAHHPKSDHRREPLRRIFHHVTERHPNRTEILRQTDELMDQELASDPEGEIEIGLLFDTICEDLDIPVDYGTLPDALLELLCPTDMDQENLTTRGQFLHATRPIHPNGTGPPS